MSHSVTQDLKQFLSAAPNAISDIYPNSQHAMSIKLCRNLSHILNLILHNIIYTSLMPTKVEKALATGNPRARNMIYLVHPETSALHRLLCHHGMWPSDLLLPPSCSGQPSGVSFSSAAAVSDPAVSFTNKTSFFF